MRKDDLQIILYNGDNERYQLRCGRFGVYVYDSLKEYGITMIDIVNYLNDNNVEGRALENETKP